LGVLFSIVFKNYRMSQLYQEYKRQRKTIADIENILGVLGWDHEVFMPKEGAAFRAQQVSTLSGIYHEFATAKEYGDVLDKLRKESGLSYKEGRNVAESYKALEKNRKLSKSFIEKESKTYSEAYQDWIKARREDNFAVFAPKLKEVVDIQREKAELWGYKEHPYDALLDIYEPDLTTSHVTNVFKDVKTHLSSFFAGIVDLPQPNQSFFENKFDKEKQMALCRQLITDLGYDWDAGRLDLSEHPFSTSFNAKDARITTRVNESDICESIWGSIHETGHALYEMGLPVSEYGLPSGSPISLSMHESQSRLWENNVGKSYNYIKTYWPVFQQYFPEAFGKTDDLSFFRGLNTVKPDLIRINSDEATYHFHILLRFEIEKSLIEGTVEVEDLEELWNSKIKEYLRLDVPSPKMGVLQDIHWSHGSFGYFPTYSLGSFYSAQFYHFASLAIPDLEAHIANKDFKPLLQWLRENIHQYGHQYSSEELCKKITGEGLNFKYFNNYLDKKYALVYQR
jgi:carboxypeptidase Taq